MLDLGDKINENNKSGIDGDQQASQCFFGQGTTGLRRRKVNS